jgi:hypothetical protein
MSEETTNDVIPEAEDIVKETPAEEIVAEDKAEEIAAPLLEEVKPVEAEPVKEDSNTITNDQGKSNAEAQVMGEVANGVIGATTTKAAPKVKKEPKKTASEIKNDDVAIYSSRNVYWDGVGRVSLGYNIVSKEAAAKWLTRSHVREASADEVAREFLK